MYRKEAGSERVVHRSALERVEPGSLQSAECAVDWRSRLVQWIRARRRSMSNAYQICVRSMSCLDYYSGNEHEEGYEESEKLHDDKHHGQLGMYVCGLHCYRGAAARICAFVDFVLCTNPRRD